MFETFEVMYQYLWEFIYKICEILKIDISNPYAK